jgi:hypothetical protein
MHALALVVAQVWVYEEADERGPANLYVHHSLLLPAFPLALTWLDCDPSGRVRLLSCPSLGRVVWVVASLQAASTAEREGVAGGATALVGHALFRLGVLHRRRLEQRGLGGKCCVIGTDAGFGPALVTLR